MLSALLLQMRNQESLVKDASPMVQDRKTLKQEINEDQYKRLPTLVRLIRGLR